MQLRNKEDGNVYEVETMEDGDTFAIFARMPDDSERFVRHYISLADMCEEWEDVD